MRSLLPLLLAAGPAFAEVPAVATDIAPVHSLAAQVMGDLGSPVQILPAGASPHDHALRPSEAAALERADVVFWVGPELTPGLARALPALAAGATSVELLDAQGLSLRDFSGGSGDGHQHEGTDPHAWLAPTNAALWLTAIADTLAQLDPVNEETYRANAAQGAARIAEATEAARARLTPVQRLKFLTFHDAYGYFSEAFDLSDAGAISFGDGAAPGPAHLAELQDEVRAGDITCVFTEVQFAPALAEILLEGTEARSATLDPLGTDLEQGPGLYPALIEEMAETVAGCLAG
ncbi:zinc ABC transporter substrate-binding protein [Pseudoroseicyclus tamaricis]|uniref:High-affinity zinc uptake system protein ZnuA n=1 Tax=Pseudoroseicyclus tamaricis TaxID=2705421 RepID=A0A6B2JFB7_9RHOB|nr:zinc ABC transporter substrate-binding protein [Pseudoroseicyclus tamaricis]NDU99710.1 zinc ABC transporter solute-binding protein [Pseudoroseicyclus tamaricis]